MEYRKHTSKTRQLSRIVENMKNKQKRLRDRWLDLDMLINACEHRINRMLRRD